MDELTCLTPLPALVARRGIEPIVLQRLNARDEADTVAQWLLERHRAGHAWKDMAILAPGKRNWRDPIAKACARDGIPVRMLLGDKTIQPDFDGDHVHVMTLFAAEGLAIPVVAVVGIGDLPWKSQTTDGVVSLLSMAMTRATHALMICHSKRSALVERLESTSTS